VVERALELDELPRLGVDDENARHEMPAATESIASKHRRGLASRRPPPVCRAVNGLRVSMTRAGE
jgi:hypothetical protein